jgi:hypothetical protein
MAHTPLKMSIDQAQIEVNNAWSRSYSPEAISEALDSIGDKHVGHRINILIARLCFRGIYFPQMSRWAWGKVILQNRRTIFRVLKDGVAALRTARAKRQVELAPSPPV